MSKLNPLATGGPPTMVALFSYGGVWPMTMINTIRDLCGAATAMGVISQRDDAQKLGFVPSGASKLMQPWQVSLTIPHGDALIDRARSICARDFLKTTAEVLIMIDHDMEWAGAGADYEGDLLHVARLARETKGIVGAVVSKRVKGEGVATLFKEERILNMGQPELIEVFYQGSAFTAYHRSAIEAVYETQAEVGPGFKPIFLPCVVDHPGVPGEKLHLSEDWAFCHRAIRLGVKVYATTRPIIGHWGHHKYTVAGDSEPAPVEGKKEKHPAVARDIGGKFIDAWASGPPWTTTAGPGALTISMLHATRGRPKQARDAYDRWMRAASGDYNLEYVLSMDRDDETMHTEIQADGWPETVVQVWGESRPGPVDAYNRALYASTGDIIVQVHDDIVPPKGWDKLAVEALDGRMVRDANKPGVDGVCDLPVLLHVDDCQTCNPDKPWLLTILIGTRAWFKRAGFFYHPGYPSVLCDDDVSQMAMKAGAVIEAKHIKFKHAWGGQDGDETYRRAYQPANWEAGKAHFEARKAAGFPFEPERWGK